MSQEMTYKRNDTGPDITVVCLDGPEGDPSSSPVNLTGATSAKFLMGTINAQGNSTVKVTGAASFDPDRTTGKVTYSWASTDLDSAGDYKAEVEVTWSSGDKQTFPGDGYLTIHVVADVG
jgi:hypothetical protein